MELSRDSFAADELVVIPPPVRPVVLKSGGPVMEVLEVIDDQIGAPTGADLLADLTAQMARQVGRHHGRAHAPGLEGADLLDDQRRAARPRGEYRAFGGVAMSRSGVPAQMRVSFLPMSELGSCSITARPSGLLSAACAASCSMASASPRPLRIAAVRIS